MGLVKLPLMDKKEYDQLIKEEYICRIAFEGEHPYMAPFLYVFHGNYLYFLSTKYGKKIEMFRENPKVAVEIERYAKSLDEYKFVTMQGSIHEIKDVDEVLQIKQEFVNMIQKRNLSTKILAALGHSPEDPVDSLVTEENSLVWKLVDVQKIVGIKNP